MTKTNIPVKNPSQSKGTSLFAQAAATVKKEKERKSALSAAGVKDVDAYDAAYAPLKNFDKDVSSLYEEITSLGRYHTASDTQIANTRKNAEKMLSRVNSINSFIDTYGEIYDQSATAEMKSGLSEISKGISEWLTESSAPDYSKSLGDGVRNAVSSPSATSRKDLENEAERLKKIVEYRQSLLEDSQKLAPQMSENKSDKAGKLSFVGSTNTLVKKRSDELSQAKAALANVEALLENYDDYDSFAQSPDFEKYSRMGAEIKNPTFGEVGKGAEIGNVVTYFRENTNPIHAINANETGTAFYPYMTDNEVSTYNYILAKNGKEKAQKYLNYIWPNLEQRAGKDIAEQISEMDSGLGKSVATGAVSLLAGLEQYGSGFASIFADDPLNTGAVTYAQQEATKDLGFVGKAANDALVAIGNMAPSIAIGAINPVAGQVSFGVSAAGNAYNEARKEGKSKGEAALYGIVSGTSEVMLQNLLGGIPGISGGANKLVTAARNLKNPVLRALSVYGINAFGEGTEEYIQDILDPVFRNIAFREDNEIKILSKDAAYSFLLGAISAGVLNVPSLSQSVPASRFGNGINLSGHTQNLIDKALQLPKNSEAYEIATKLNNGDLKASDQNVGEFALACARDGVDLSFLYGRSGAVEEMARKGDVVAEPVAEARAEESDERIPAIDKMIEESKSDKSIISNKQAREILDDPQLMDALGISVDKTADLADKRRAVKDAVQKYSEKIAAQRLANEVAQSTENIVADARRARAEQTDGQTASEGSAANADTFRYHYNVDDQRLGQNTINQLRNISSSDGTKLADKLVDMATSVTGDSDANRAVYKMFENPVYAALASIEHSAEFNEIVKALPKTATNFATQRMLEFERAAAGVATVVELARGENVNVRVGTVEEMAVPGEGGNARGFYQPGKDGKAGTIVISPRLNTYDALVSTVVHEAFHADGRMDKALVNNVYDYAKDALGNAEKRYNDKKRKLEEYTGVTASDGVIKEEIAAEFIGNVFKVSEDQISRGVDPTAQVSAIFNSIDGSDRLLARMKKAWDRFINKLKRRTGSNVPDGKITSLRDFLDTLLVKTQKGYTSVNEGADESNAPSKKTKAEKKAKAETKAEPEVVEEIDLDEELDEDFDEEFDDGLTDEERGAVDLASDFLEGEIKNTAEGGRLYSSKDTEVKKGFGAKNTEYNKPITMEDVEKIHSITKERGQVSVNNLTSSELKVLQKWAHKYKLDTNIGIKSPFFRAWFGEWRAHQKNDYVTVAIIPEYVGTNEARKKNRGTVVNGDTGWDIRISREGETNTISHAGTEKRSEYGLAGIRELIENAYLFDTELHEHHANDADVDRIALDHKLYALGKDEKGDIALYKITVEESYHDKKNTNDRAFHNLRYIEKVASVGGRTAEQSLPGVSTNDSNATEYSIAELYEFVKTYDADFTPAQSVSEKVLNRDGTPKVFYHGSPYQFYAFDKKKAKSSGLYGKGFYFTDSNTHAKQYGNLYAVYLDVKNPLSEGSKTVTGKQIRRFLQAVSENEDYSIENYGTYDVNEILKGITSRDAFAVITDINATAIGDMVEATKLFNKVNGTRFDGIVVPTETVVFNPTQIKAVDNVGTYDKRNKNIYFSAEDTDVGLSEKEWVDSLTEEQYNNYSWVRANDVLTSNQYKDFERKFANPKGFTKTADGAYVIPVGGAEEGYGFGVDNVLVYARPTRKVLQPKIEKIVKINLDDETSIDIVRRAILDDERHSVTAQSRTYETWAGSGLVATFSRSDYPSLGEFKRSGKRTVGTNAYRGTNALQDIGGSEASNRTTSDNKIKYSSEDTDVNTTETPLATVNDFNAEVNRIYRGGKAAGKTDEEIGKEVEEAARARNDGAGARFGFIEPGENPVREVRVPKQTSKDDKVSLTVRTAEEAGSTTEEVLPSIDSMIANGTFSYKPLKNKELKAKCKERIGSTRESYREALRSWERKDKLVSAEDIAMGWMLYDEALKQNEQSVALDILVRISTEVRTHAQAVQANRILKTLSPAGKMYVARRTAERLTEKLKEEGKVPRKRYTDEERATVEDARKYGKRYADGRISKTFSKLGLGDNVPVEEWAKEIGNDVAAAISKRMAPLNPKEMLVSRTVANDLVQFAENYALPKKQTSNKNRSAAERVADFFANRDQYVEAWNQAREVLREQYKDRPDKLDLLEAFLNGTIDYNGEGSDALMMRAVAEAALNNDVKMRDIMSRAELGDIKAVMDEIYSRLQETVKAEGSDAQLLRDAVQRWVTEKYVQFHPLTQKQIDAVIRKKMRELGKSVDYIIRQDRTEKGDMLQQITAMLVNEFGVSREGAASAAVKIKEHYDVILEKASRAAFERATKERKPVDRKSLDELFANYANMGAFTSDYNKALTEKLFKQEGIEVNKRLAEDYLAAETDEGRDKALEEIYKDIGSQIPSTFADKERAWRYLSMLANLRTHVRNVFGNAKFALDVITKDAVATMIEAGYAKTHDIERTKAFLNPKKDKALIEAARKDTAVVHDMLVYGEKYNDQATNAAIDEGRVIFEGKVGKYVEWLRKKNTWLLEKEDAIFLNAHYTHALAQYCKANGITAKQIENGDVPDAARAYAIKEAKKATFRDENIFSNAISRMRFRGDDPVSKSLNFLVEGVFPFRKTPANILVRGVEYSPLGLAKGLYDMATKVRKGEKSAAEAIDEIASGLTGTALLALGYIWTALGFIRATGDEDEKKFDELMGHQIYALEIGNFSMTLDWLAPSAIPFFVGAEIAELKRLQGDVKMADITSTMLNILGPMLELSCLQSFNELLESVAYARENEATAAIVASAVTSRLTQYIPTIFGQTERTFENKRMMAYTEKDSFLTSDAQYLLSSISAKLPGVDYQQIPYIDAWGRIKDTGPWWARPLNNFINPAYLSNITTSAMETELQRLKDATGKTSVYPPEAKKRTKKVTVSKKVNGKRESEEYNLSAEEYVQYATSKGNIAYNAITAFMGGTVYKTLNDTERVDAIEDIYSYADQYAMTVITDHEPEGWIAEAIEAQQKGMSFDTFFEAYVAQSSITADRDFLGNVISGTAADKKKEIIDGITTDTYERDMLYDYLGVGKTAQNDGIIASIIDAALRKDTEAYDKATQDYLKRNEGATRGDLTEAKSKYLAAEQERLAKLYYDDKSEYERQVAKYRDGKDRAIASKFNSKSMEAARTRWKNEYTEELAEKLAKYANDSEKVKLIYAEAAKYGIDSTKLEARAKVYARKK